ncbi:hypothetical protein BDZ94DRAFT_1064352 [Collybia nuda]|uniref:Uncharacterized protein n=1 Tax=Collybia nuda TaxID=64659 RepID=A0A9P5XYK8_9AGAR|nr:hypothetical protein BDZ94DRAFT_1064352 [Collybia nuda]
MFDDPLDITPSAFVETSLASRSIRFTGLQDINLMDTHMVEKNKSMATFRDSNGRPKMKGSHSSGEETAA